MRRALLLVAVLAFPASTPAQPTGLAPLLAAPALLLSPPAAAPPTRPASCPGLPSETPAKFVPATDAFDFVRREVMILMRDGVKLHTVILVPRGAKRAPILLTRTPYDTDKLTTRRLVMRAEPRAGREEVTWTR